MSQISPHLVLAAAVMARHLSQVHLAAAAHTLAGAGGLIALIVLTLGAVVLAAVAHGARLLAALMAQFLQVAAAMMSVLLVIVVAAVAVGFLLIHH